MLPLIIYHLPITKLSFLVLNVRPIFFFFFLNAPFKKRIADFLSLCLQMIAFDYLYFRLVAEITWPTPISCVFKQIANIQCDSLELFIFKTKILSGLFSRGHRRGFDRRSVHPWVHQ